MIISSRIQHASFRIYVNDVLHIHFMRDKFIGLQSWQYETENLFYIEITLESGVINCDYDKRDMWLSILKEFDKIR